MKVYVVVSTQTVGQDTDCWVYKKKADAEKYMEELTGTSRADWEYDSVVYEDAQYIESVAYIVEKEIQ